MAPFRVSIICLCLLFCGTFLFGCSSKNHVRHITSEIGLVTPNKTTQKELVSFMGFPELKRTISESEEEWIYYQENKSFLRHTPFLGHKMGEADYDVAIITFRDEMVISSQYRSFTEEEFEKLGIAKDAEQ